MKEKFKNEILEKSNDYLNQASTILDYWKGLNSAFDYTKISIATSEQIIAWATRKYIINPNFSKAIEFDKEEKQKYRLEQNLKKKILKKNKTDFLEENTDKEIKIIELDTNKNFLIGQLLSFETLKFDNFKPVKTGLFCPSIFGPIRTGICECGYKKEDAGIGTYCPECHVEFTDSRVRRYRMGFFNLLQPVSHIWFLKGRPSYYQILLDKKKSWIEDILYYKIDLGEEFILKFPSFSKKKKETFSSFATYKQNTKKNVYLIKAFLSFCIQQEKEKNDYLKFLKIFQADIFFLEKKIKEIDSFLNYFETYLKNYKFLATIIKKLKNFKTRKFILEKKIKELKFFLNQINFEKKKDYTEWDEIFENYLERFFSLQKKKNKFLDYSNQSIERIFYSKFFQTIKQKSNEKEKNRIQFLKSILKNFSNELENFKNKIFERSNSQIIYSMLEDLNLKEEIKILREMICFSDVNKTKKFLKRLRILENFEATKISPTALMLTDLPILPPTLRPIEELESGQLMVSDINEMYKLIILRTYRMIEDIPTNGIFFFIKANGAKSVQEAVDCLIDNSRLPKNRIMTTNNKPLKSLTETIEGKEGRIRLTLLGKRVDYSGRSVISVGSELKLNQCALPLKIAKILFEPILIQQILELNNSNSKKKNIILFSTKRKVQILLKKIPPLIWSLLYSIVKNYSILLNRAPTLHKFGIQSFEPIITPNLTIQLHPLVCSGYNADFDGDQMAVHLPLYKGSQFEIKNLLKTSSNVFLPSNGKLVLKPSQDIIIGSFYATFMEKENKRNFPYYFGNIFEIINALEKKIINLHSPIFLKYFLKKIYTYEIENKEISLMINLFPLNNKPLKIFKTIKNVKNYIYIFTEYGIVIGKNIDTKTYILTEFFFDTTPGRILFSLNFEYSIKEAEKLCF